MGSMGRRNSPARLLLALARGYASGRDNVSFNSLIRLIRLLFFGVFVSYAWADESETADFLDLSLDQLVQIEIPTVIGASKYEQSSSRAPSSVSVITAAEIKSYGWLKLSDILRSVRGFVAINDRNYEFLTVRGFGLPGDYTSRMLLLIDGLRINDSLYQQAAVGGDFPLDVDLIDRVEIIRVPGSALYGSSAFFGVINVISKKAGNSKVRKCPWAAEISIRNSAV